MKQNIYVCLTESFCCIAEIKHNIVNQLYFNKILKSGYYGIFKFNFYFGRTLAQYFSFWIFCNLRQTLNISLHEGKIPQLLQKNKNLILLPEFPCLSTFQVSSSKW